MKKSTVLSFCFAVAIALFSPAVKAAETGPVSLVSITETEIGGQDAPIPINPPKP